MKLVAGLGNPGAKSQISLPSSSRPARLGAVTKPLALVFYERLLPGSRISNRLADLGWRVTEAKAPGDIVPLVRTERPLLVIAEVAQQFGVSRVTARKWLSRSHALGVVGLRDASRAMIAWCKT